KERLALEYETFVRIRGVNRVVEEPCCQIAPDGTRSTLPALGRTDHPSHQRYRVPALQDCTNDRSAGDERYKLTEERFLAVDAVEFFGPRLAHGQHLEVDYLHASPFESGQYLPYVALRDGVGLHHYQRTFYRRERQLLLPPGPF